MISELYLIRSYSSFWRSLFPGGEDYIRLINSSLGEKINKHIEVNESADRRALINGISFSMFKASCAGKLSIPEIDSLSTDSYLIKDLLLEERRNLYKLGSDKNQSISVSVDELLIIKMISNRLVQRYSKLHNLIIQPKFRGCGIIFESFGDIIYKNVLTEIKSGDRNFNIQDIRQLYVYLSLNHYSKEFSIRQIELYNPRTGVMWKEHVEVVSDNIAGASSVEIYNEIINFISDQNRSI